MINTFLPFLRINTTSQILIFRDLTVLYLLSLMDLTLPLRSNVWKTCETTNSEQLTYRRNFFFSFPSLDMCIFFFSVFFMTSLYFSFNSVKFESLREFFFKIYYVSRHYTYTMSFFGYLIWVLFISTILGKRLPHILVLLMTDLFMNPSLTTYQILNYHGFDYITSH